MQQLSELEIDLLLLFYTYSDQYGKVDMAVAKNAASKKLGIILSPKQIVLQQKHLDALMNVGDALPDIRDLMLQLKDVAHPLKKKKPRKKK